MSRILSTLAPLASAVSATAASTPLGLLAAFSFSSFSRTGTGLIMGLLYTLAATRLGATCYTEILRLRNDLCTGRLAPFQSCNLPARVERRFSGGATQPVR